MPTTRRSARKAAAAARQSEPPPPPKSKTPNNKRKRRQTMDQGARDQATLSALRAKQERYNQRKAEKEQEQESPEQQRPIKKRRKSTASGRSTAASCRSSTATRKNKTTRTTSGKKTTKSTPPRSAAAAAACQKDMARRPSSSPDQGMGQPLWKSNSPILQQQSMAPPPRPVLRSPPVVVPPPPACVSQRPQDPSPMVNMEDVDVLEQRLEEPLDKEDHRSASRLFGWKALAIVALPLALTAIVTEATTTTPVVMAWIFYGLDALLWTSLAGLIYCFSQHFLVTSSICVALYGAWHFLLGSGHGEQGHVATEKDRLASEIQHSAMEYLMENYSEPGHQVLQVYEHVADQLFPNDSRLDAAKKMKTAWDLAADDLRRDERILVATAVQRDFAKGPNQREPVETWKWVGTTTSPLSS